MGSFPGFIALNLPLAARTGRGKVGFLAPEADCRATLLSLLRAAWLRLFGFLFVALHLRYVALAVLSQEVEVLVHVNLA